MAVLLSPKNMLFRLKAIGGGRPKKKIDYIKDRGEHANFVLESKPEQAVVNDLYCFHLGYTEKGEKLYFKQSDLVKIYQIIKESLYILDRR
jgi:hypothetical protein